MIQQKEISASVYQVPPPEVQLRPALVHIGKFQKCLCKEKSCYIYYSLNLFSDGQLRQTSTSTSNYNSNSDAPSFLRGFESTTTSTSRRAGRREEKQNRVRRDSDSGSDETGRSLELASSHSSDDDESRTVRSTTTHRSTTNNSTTAYLPNITEHVQATTPPELNVVQSPQLFPNINKSILPGRWASQLPDAYLQQGTSTGNVGRWSQDTGSDNEHIHSNQHKITISPNPLPHPDLTDTSYMQQHHPGKINMPPSILENLQINSDLDENDKDNMYDKYRKNGQDNYSFKLPSHYGSEKSYPGGGGGGSQTISYMRSYHPDVAYLSDSIYDKHATLGSYKTDSPYFSKDRASPNNYGSARKNQYSLKKQQSFYTADAAHDMPLEYQQNIQSGLLQKPNYAQTDYHSDRISEGGSDQNGYHFPYTAEEDHISTRKLNYENQHNLPLYRSTDQNLTNVENDVNNPGFENRNTFSDARYSSTTASSPINNALQTMGPLNGSSDTEYVLIY